MVMEKLEINDAQTAVAITMPDGRRAWVTMNRIGQAIALEWVVPENRDSEGRAVWLCSEIISRASRMIRGCI